MKSIGIRVSPKCIYYCIIETKDDIFNILDVSCLNVPRSTDMPFTLSFIRTNLFSIIQEYRITHAGIRIAEQVSRNISVPRMYIEGVIQELLADSNIEQYYAGMIVNIASLIQEDQTTIKDFFEGDEVFAGIEDWKSYKKEERESIVAAVAACHLEED